jgi:hypothetical protein
MVRSFFAVLAGTLALSQVPAFAGTFTQSAFSSDADSGISSSLLYTAAIDFQGPGNRVVNGVTFGDAGTTGNYYALTGVTNTFTGNINNLAGNVNGLATDFVYGETGTANLTLGGLIPGTQYVTSWYNVGFGAPAGRVINITPSDTGVAFAFDENFSGDKNGNILRYTFTATQKFISYTFDAAIAADTFHHYAVTNSGSLVSKSLTPVSPVSTDAIAGAERPFVPFAVSSTDLLQSSVSGVTSTGNFLREVTGGVPSLTNGAFSITGIANNNPELASGENNASVTWTLDTSVNAFGYDISSIAGYGGWNDNGRNRQFYNIYVSFVGDPTFTLFGGVNRDVAGENGGPSATRNVFTPNGTLSGIDGVRIDFPNGQENGFAGYGEFDVIGTATVPEPASAILLLGGVMGTVSLRRNRRRA